MCTISEILETDAVILQDIHRKCFLDGWNEEYFAGLIRNGCFFGFISEDIRSIKNGFILAKKVFDEVEIITFCVLENCRNTGIGKTLLNKITDISAYSAIEFCENKSLTFFLDVAENNFSAIHLYKSLGFCEISKRAGYYMENNKKIDAIVMRLEKMEL